MFDCWAGEGGGGVGGEMPDIRFVLELIAFAWPGPLCCTVEFVFCFDCWGLLVAVFLLGFAVSHFLFGAGSLPLSRSVLEAFLFCAFSAVVTFFFDLLFLSPALVLFDRPPFLLASNAFFFFSSSASCSLAFFFCFTCFSCFWAFCFSACFFLSFSMVFEGERATEWPGTALFVLDSTFSMDREPSVFTQSRSWGLQARHIRNYSDETAIPRFNRAGSSLSLFTC